ncbi:MAG: uroporphyrinogen decarboxylase family protein [Olsenella profusa]
MYDRDMLRESLDYFETIRALDEMTPNERSRALAHGEAVDRMPIGIMADLTVPRMMGTTFAECEKTARDKAEQQIAAYRLFGADGTGLMYGLHSLAIAYGGAYKQPPNETKVLLDAPLRRPREDVPKLSLDDIVFDEDPNAYVTLEALEMIRDEIGDEVGTGVNFTSPFTAASGLVGVETFLRGLIRREEWAPQLIEFTVSALFKLAEPFLKEGFGVSTCDPVASCTIINPKLYRTYALPSELRFQELVRQYTHAPMHMHICGDTTKILEDVAGGGFSEYSLDNVVDLGVAKERIGDKIRIQGNVDPVGLMELGTPDQIEDKTKECFRKAWDSPKGFQIHSGCDMPFDSSNENIFRYLKVAKTLAAEQARALEDPDPERPHGWDA